MGETFECEIQARLRDMNLGGHVDNIEAMRVLDEARLLFLRYADLPLTPLGDRTGGLFCNVPAGVVELVGSQRVDYRAEMRFVAFQPFRVRMWVGHIGGSSFTMCSELRVAPDHEPALVAEAGLVLWDSPAGSAWKIDDQVRSDFTAFLGDPVPLRPRPN